MFILYIKTLDSVYELLNFDIIDGKHRPYLKMLNPSTGNWRVEGIHPKCKTINQALGFQNPFVEEKDWSDENYIYVHPVMLT